MNKRYADAVPAYQARGAKAKHLDGMAILGVMYLYGKGVEKDGRKAETWLSRATEAGQVSAQSILEMIYGHRRQRAKKPAKSSEMVVQDG